MKGKEMDDDMSAAKEALGIIKQGLRERSLRRKAPDGGAGAPDGNVGEVMEREQEILAATEAEPEEQDEEIQPEPQRRTVLESFVPRLSRQAMSPPKRGPGRPRKG